MTIATTHEDRLRLLDHDAPLRKAAEMESAKAIRVRADLRRPDRFDPTKTARILCALRRKGRTDDAYDLFCDFMEWTSKQGRKMYGIDLLFWQAVERLDPDWIKQICAVAS